MVKAKFGALVLTVLMGLGAISPLHGVTEAHARNVPAANSAQQKTVASMTDNSDGVMSYKDKMIIPGLSEPPVRTLGATIPENESHIFR